MKKLITCLLVLLSFFFFKCEKEENDIEQYWHCYTFEKIWQTEIDLFTGKIISRKEIWFPVDTTMYYESDGYSQEIIERRIEMISEKKKIVCYP